MGKVVGAVRCICTCYIWPQSKTVFWLSKTLRSNFGPKLQWMRNVAMNDGRFGRTLTALCVPIWTPPTTPHSPSPIPPSRSTYICRKSENVIESGQIESVREFPLRSCVTHMMSGDACSLCTFHDIATQLTSKEFLILWGDFIDTKDNWGFQIVARCTYTKNNQLECHPIHIFYNLYIPIIAVVWY